jgi:transcriptional regulator with XRE-family HTH domain
MTELDFITIGKHIKERRQLLGLTQEHIANQLDVNPSHISNIECGRAHPSLTALVQIANLLQCSVDCFLQDEYFYTDDNQRSATLNDAIMQQLTYYPDFKKEKLLKIMELL